MQENVDQITFKTYEELFEVWGSKDAYSKVEIEEKFDVERTNDGKYIVMYMNFNCPPPPKGKTPEEAIELFKEYRNLYIEKIEPQLPEDLDEIGTGSTTQNSQNVESTEGIKQL